MSLQLDPETFRWADDLRRAHFPPARNVLSAHLTLFHALPGDRSSEVMRTIEEVSAEFRALKLDFPTVRFLGNGVAIDVRSPELERFRARLRERFLPWLTSQDQQKFRPHITVQNKVPASEARALFEALAKSWRPRIGTGLGCTLFQYLGGPWERVRAFGFAGLERFDATSE